MNTPEDPQTARERARLGRLFPAAGPDIDRTVDALIASDQELEEEARERAALEAERRDALEPVDELKEQAYERTFARDAQDVEEAHRRYHIGSAARRIDDLVELSRRRVEAYAELDAGELELERLAEDGPR